MEENFWKDAFVIDASPPKDETGVREVICDSCNRLLGMEKADCDCFLFKSDLLCHECAKSFVKEKADRIYKEGEYWLKEPWY